MPEDPYPEILACAAELRALGLEAEAEEIDRALCGSTSGEILTLTGVAVQQALRRRKEIPKDLRRRMKALLRGIDRLLKPPFWS